jgi:hypothetical protein
LRGRGVFVNSRSEPETETQGFRRKTHRVPRHIE